jgi:hypothetical protein
MSMFRSLGTSFLVVAALVLAATSSAAAEGAPDAPSATRSFNAIGATSDLSVRNAQCVQTSASGGLLTKTFTMKNICTFNIRARMILANHVDTDCVGLSPNEKYSVTVAATAILTEAVLC